MTAEFTSEEMLDVYLHIWNNRIVQHEKQDKGAILSELIRRELLDENTHPRVRKPVFEKFYYSIKRLTDSGISSEKLHELTEIYIAEMERIKKK